MIEIMSVSKSYGAITALNDVSFTVPDGCITGFVGPNGAGKSTLMRIALGLERPDAGTVTHDGVRVGDRPAGTLGAGALLDPSWLFGRRRAGDHLWALAAASGLGRDRVADALRITGLSGVADRPAGTFSLGMRQRLGIAAALLDRPRSLVLDEPVNGLDPDGVGWLRGLVRGLADGGTAVLISSHLLSELAQTADRIVVIAAGRILSEGPLTALLSASGPAVVLAASDQPDRLAAACSAHGAEVIREPSGRLRINGPTPREVSRLAAEAGVLLDHLSAHTASLEERFTALTTDHLQYRADVPVR